MAVETVPGLVWANHLSKRLPVFGKLYTQAGHAQVSSGELKDLLEISLSHLFTWKSIWFWIKEFPSSSWAQFFSSFIWSYFSQKDMRFSPCEALVSRILFLQISVWLAFSLPLCILRGPFLIRALPGHCISHWPSTRIPDSPSTTSLLCFLFSTPHPAHYISIYLFSFYHTWIFSGRKIWLFVSLLYPQLLEEGLLQNKYWIQAALTLHGISVTTQLGKMRTWYQHTWVSVNTEPCKAMPDCR